MRVARVAAGAVFLAGVSLTAVGTASALEGSAALGVNFTSEDDPEVPDIPENTTEVNVNAGPGNTTEDPGNTTEDPGNTTEDPGNTTEDPGNTTEDPGNTTEDPGNTTEDPGNTTEDPGNTTEDPGTDSNGGSTGGSTSGNGGSTGGNGGSTGGNGGSTGGNGGSTGGNGGSTGGDGEQPASTGGTGGGDEDANTCILDESTVDCGGTDTDSVGTRPISQEKPKEELAETGAAETTFLLIGAATMIAGGIGFRLMPRMVSRNTVA